MKKKYIIEKNITPRKKLNKKREVSDIFITDSSGKQNTRINPINRHSEYGFALRLANKLNRISSGVKAYRYPQFIK